MNVKNLYLTVGTPGSGKSTYLAKHSIFDSVIISRDVIRFSLIKENESYFSKEDQVFKKFVESIQDALNWSSNVYVDATHLNERSRNKLLDALNLDNVKLYALYFTTPLETCLERNAKREGRARVPDDVIRRMYGSMTDPSNDKKYKFKVKYVR